MVCYLNISYRSLIIIKAPEIGALFSGERGIRTPGPLLDNGFQDRRIRPLCHLSVKELQYKNFFYFSDNASAPLTISDISVVMEA